ncbi:class I SAM-dependent methyltransferase [Candidatus Peregrinibacteria bacterium]|nr:class I SAM-dependent methyltransferase [Candidatus Peregrinibacteria bacterium]
MPKNTGLPPKEGFARYAHEYDDREKYWDSFEQDALTPYIHAAQGKKVLDAGAGTGRLALRLKKAGAEVTALDISSDMLDLLQKKDPEITIVEGDVEAMPLPDGTFDMVFSSLTLVHLKEIEPFLDECYRVLKDDGKLVLVNVHYRKPMVLKDGKGKYIIQCYNHFPRHVREAAESLAFGVEKELILKEEDNIWISHVLVLRK